MSLLSPVVIREHLERIKDGLLDFFASSAHAALRGGQVQVEGTDIDVNLDVDENGLACCELTVYTSTSDDVDDAYTILIVLSMLRISRSDGCRSGNEYLRAVRDMIDHFFIRSNPVFEDIPIRRMSFKVEDDMSTLTVIEPLHITTYMYDTTTKISNMEVVNGLDFHSMKLSELLHTQPGYTFGQDRDVSDFWSYVIREDLPDVYQGSVRVSRLAGMVLHGVAGFERVSYQLFCKIWFHHILPLVIGRKKHTPRGKLSKQYNDAHDDPDDPDYIKFNYEYTVELGVITLLSRDDFKTWYMHHLNLSVCDDSFGPIDSKEMDDEVRAVQETPFVDIVPTQFKKYFGTMRTPTKQVVLQCMTNMRVHKRLTYYEYLQLSMVKSKYNTELTNKLTGYLRSVCRELF
jgi:hypothetical protein